MSSESQRPIVTNGHAIGDGSTSDAMEKLNTQFRKAMADPVKMAEMAEFHGDHQRAHKQLAVVGRWADVGNFVTLNNASSIAKVLWKLATGDGLDTIAASKVVASLPDDSPGRAAFIENEVRKKYQKMLHPPLTYLGDAFQYRTADGKFNNVLSPHLGQAGAPYAKTVPTKTHTLGALPDPGDIFDRLMARQDETRESESGLSSMLLYHATILIHDIFRTNDKDKNISDSSSYLDLSPLYGYTEEMQRKVRDGKHKLGLLLPDTFAEDRLLRQPPGVCIMLVMYNRYHNYAASQLRRINENGRFSVPSQYLPTKLVAIAQKFDLPKNGSQTFRKYFDEYQDAWVKYKKDGTAVSKSYVEAELEKRINAESLNQEVVDNFTAAYDAAWNKLDDDLFHTARLITCGIYVNVSIHDYLRALMGLHKYDTTFTLDPRVAIDKNGQRDAISRGVGNQVTTEFNLLYRFHCAISKRDEEYTEDFMKQSIGPYVKPRDMEIADWDPKTLTLEQYSEMSRAPQEKILPCHQTFGIKTEGSCPREKFSRNSISGLFDDKQMVDELVHAMDAPIGNFGALNVPRCLKSIEIMGIIQARKWEVGTLNDFREFFGMPRHKDFKSIAGDREVQNALRDLYDHPDQVELYPGIFCEGDAKKSIDPGPNETTYALWAAIFSDAITLVRSDRFYTVDWNTKSLTSWGMKEVTPNNDVFKSSVFHRLIQRAFPEWFPYNSVRFFHPFYTGKANIIFAAEQGYDGKSKMEFTESNPERPVKPIYLKTHSKIKAVLSDNSGQTRNPASFDTFWLPDEVAKLFSSETVRPKPSASGFSEADKGIVLNYFTEATREMIKREAYMVNSHNDTFQIDVTRDLAIPVVTRFIADFLGFSRRVKTPSNPNAEFSENEIYQHITNCQVISAYIADETKICERRAEARKSMKILFDLAKGGNIDTASQITIRSLTRLFSAEDPSPTNMAELGLTVARQTLKREKNDTGKAAAILLLTALDGAYNSVLAFSAVLNRFMEGLYAQPDNCDWKNIQRLATKDPKNCDQSIRELVMNAQQLSVKMPIIRKVVTPGEITDDENKKVLVKEGTTIICDVYQAYASKLAEDSKKKTRSTVKAASQPEDGHLTFGSSLSEGFDHFDAREVAVLGLTAMIKVLAQTKNLRRGHDTQGKLKKINIDAVKEGYANFMAPGRVRDIRDEVRSTLDLPADKKDNIIPKARADAEALKTILDSKILQPRMDAYLTPEWNEMIPFPTTWKLRFDGYGESDYSKITLNKPVAMDNIPPFYQPQGPSHFGGSFADLLPETLPASEISGPPAGCGALGH